LLAYADRALLKELPEIELTRLDSLTQAYSLLYQGGDVTVKGRITNAWMIRTIMRPAKLRFFG
jgi:hypothetical protein